MFSGAGALRLGAQQNTATILGTVTDPTGASIAGAAVEVRNVGTGMVQATATDAAGRYNVPDLPVGDYEVQASKDGFATVVHKGITLTVGSQNVVDFSLAVGQTQQTVTVEGAGYAGGNHQLGGRFPGQPDADARAASERPRILSN